MVLQRRHAVVAPVLVADGAAGEYHREGDEQADDDDAGDEILLKRDGEEARVRPVVDDQDVAVDGHDEQRDPGEYQAEADDHELQAAAEIVERPPGRSNDGCWYKDDLERIQNQKEGGLLIVDRGYISKYTGQTARKW